ncbi:MAG TPA: YihY/virulence factor BrkB family protein [Casimicrobiaceae bacterium]|nr:YihY/virulence factor BrkB family protein [Thermoanaerobaculia bacterium]HLX29438.1 YihY/virulence factor BrkB family protein [Casimicrobiaceae bacterium]
MLNVKSLWSLARQSVSQWSEDFAPSMGAALAYYTIFSIAPLLVIAIAVAGFFFGNEAARGEIFGQLRGLLGERGADTIQAAVASAGQTGHGTFAAIVGIVALLLGATTVFGELQSDLDRIWDSPKPAHSGIRGVIRGKLLSFGMVLGIGFLLLVSLVLSAALSALGKFWSGWFPGWDIVLQIVNVVVSFVVITGLFAMIYKLLPRCDIGWKDVWIGAAVTSLLFVIGKLLIGLYLGRSSVASSFGAAGSLVVVLLWVYYSAQIFLLGAEFTRAYSYSHGTRSGQAKPGKANAPTRGAPTTGTRSKPEDEGASRDPQPAPAPVPPSGPKPAFAKLRIAAGVAATLGLAAGEFLNEWRRTRSALPRRRWWRA